MLPNFSQVLSEYLLYIFRSFLGCPLKSKDEIEVMYFGRISDFLMMTSERIAISIDRNTLEQLLNRLRQRGARWAHELDDRHVICTVNGKAATLIDAITMGDVIGIYSNKSMFEI